ncbi:hypothetical protein BJV77DRAFT_1010674 [Russula vinacea]|nr:hypothetical protein BJV77DRAFT_1010674 [Russula vinacea]
MSSPITSDATLENLIRCLTNQRLAMSIEVAAAALIYYEWLLTSSDEVEWLWRRGRSTYARILFILARYAALTSVVVGLLPFKIVLRNITTYLSVLTIICSELVLAMRTWAIWQNSVAMLVFLIALTIVCAAPAIAIIERDIVTNVVIPSATWNGMQQCHVSISAIKRAWVVPYVGVIVFEVVVLSLTLYKVLQRYRAFPAQKSKLLDALWIDGVMYFFFMLLLGMLNVVLALHVSDSQVRVACTQFQTVSHSILSTRIVLHTGRVLRKGVVDLELPRSRASGESMGHSLELQRLINDGT